MAYGTPLISFAIKYGPRDILQDREAGILVPCGDEEALAAALIAVISDKSLQQSMQQAALRNAQRYYASDRRTLGGMAAASERQLDAGRSWKRAGKSVIRRLTLDNRQRLFFAAAPGAAMRRVIALLLASCCCSPLLARDVVQVSRCVPGSCFMSIAWKNARRG
jgi:ADP-ribosylglycohydrolase